jgi:hypothetical protein
MASVNIAIVECEYKLCLGHTWILGARRTGKTALCSKLLQGISEKNGSCVIVLRDATNEYLQHNPLFTFDVASFEDVMNRICNHPKLPQPFFLVIDCNDIAQYISHPKLKHILQLGSSIVRVIITTCTPDNDLRKKHPEFLEFWREYHNLFQTIVCTDPATTWFIRRFVFDLNIAEFLPRRTQRGVVFRVLQREHLAICWSCDEMCNRQLFAVKKNTVFDTEDSESMSPRSSINDNQTEYYCSHLTCYSFAPCSYHT